MADKYKVVGVWILEIMCLNGWVIACLLIYNFSLIQDTQGQQKQTQ
jgi:hypothetical protein